MATADWSEPAGAASHWSEFDGSGGDWSAPPEHIQHTYTVLCVCVCGRLYEIFIINNMAVAGLLMRAGWINVFMELYIYINVYVLERTYSPCYKI